VADEVEPLDGEAEIGSEELGETEIDAGSADSSEPPQYDFLDLDSVAGKHVSLTIDGQEVVVPLKEALDGFNLSKVSTQRLQEASEMRKNAEEALRLQDAFRFNPGLTVQILAQQAGMPVEQFLNLTPAQQQAAIEAEDEYTDPLERELAQERAARQALEQRFEQREADERLARAAGGLKQQYGATDDQVLAVVNEAMNRGLGIDSFPLIFEGLAYRAQQQAGAQHTAQQEAEAQRRRQAAAQASQSISAGSGVTSSTERAPAERFNSIREAALAAYEEVEARTR
jgi:hypothetical protein